MTNYQLFTNFGPQFVTEKEKWVFKLCGNNSYCFIYAHGKYHLTIIESSHASVEAV
jgi:hypothetical protein